MGGELLLTGFLAYKECTVSQFEEHIRNLIDKNVSGFIVKKRNENSQLLNFDTKLNTLKRICKEKEIALIELASHEHYWKVIRFVLTKVYIEEIACLKYYRLTDSNFKDYVFTRNTTATKVIDILYGMIENPIKLYYENLNCLVATDGDTSKFEILENTEINSLNIQLKYKHTKQKTKDCYQYYTTISLISGLKLYLVIDERNNKLTNLDFIAIENAIDTLKYLFTLDFAKNEINKKYHRDIFFNMINSQLSNDELIAAANMLGLKENEYYRVVSFHSIKENKKDEYSLEQLDEVDSIADVISTFFPDEHIYKNMSQIVMLQKMKSSIELEDSLEQMDRLLEIVKDSIITRNKNTDFNIGIGEIVKGYKDLQSSYRQSRIAMKFMKIAKKVTGDKNKSIVHYSKMGIFQSLIAVDNYQELAKYIPSTIIKIHNYDEKHHTEMLKTLQCYIKNNFSLNKTADELSLQYRSVSYRIKRIKEISGIDFDNGFEILSVRNGLVMFDIVNSQK